MGIKKGVLIVFIFFINLLIYSQKAEFKIVSDKLCDSVDITFIATNGTNSWVWTLDTLGRPSSSTAYSTNDTTPEKRFGPGTYYITLEIDNNLASKTKDTIIVHNSPIANVKISRLPKTGYFSRFFIDSSIIDTIRKPNYYYIFDFGDNSKKDTILNDSVGVFHKFPKEGTYNFKYKVLDISNLCADSIPITLKILDTLNLYIPNVFTPNNDGINETYIIEGNGVDDLNIEIFNRNGMLVYRYSAPIIVWDGKTLSGSIAPTGIYYYVLTSENPDIKQVNGSMYLLREDK